MGSRDVVLGPAFVSPTIEGAVSLIFFPRLCITTPARRLRGTIVHLVQAYSAVSELKPRPLFVELLIFLSLRIIACIEGQDVIDRILAHLREK